ncbi:hypothetical protein CDV36_006454 [Fusarium kuroshium]|uniref:Uncharacterized protein n=1 Tax=Fusarium kuroshium TaxID=2010991 RepID=A0A3M2S8H4_9HYPO|nr:hypothetical protein CDV36_006454 [Fusarium kuroshium]
MADHFDEGLIQRLSKMAPGTRTKEQDAYLNDYCKAAGITSDTTGTNASKTSTISLRASSINLSALSSNARSALERSMEGVEDRWNRSSMVASKANTPSPYSAAAPPHSASGRGSTVVRTRINAPTSEAGSRTTVKASGGPPKPTGAMSLDEIARLGTGTPKQTDRQFRELIDEMVTAQKTLSENDTKQRYFFFNQQKKNKDLGSK